MVEIGIALIDQRHGLRHTGVQLHRNAPVGQGHGVVAEPGVQPGGGVHDALRTVKGHVLGPGAVQAADGAVCHVHSYVQAVFREEVSVFLLGELKAVGAAAAALLPGRTVIQGGRGKRFAPQLLQKRLCGFPGVFRADSGFPVLRIGDTGVDRQQCAGLAVAGDGAPPDVVSVFAAVSQLGADFLCLPVQGVAGGTEGILVQSQDADVLQLLVKSFFIQHILHLGDAGQLRLGQSAVRCRIHRRPFRRGPGVRRRAELFSEAVRIDRLIEFCQIHQLACLGVHIVLVSGLRQVVQRRLVGVRVQHVLQPHFQRLLQLLSRRALRRRWLGGWNAAGGVLFQALPVEICHLSVGGPYGDREGEGGVHAVQPDFTGKAVAGHTQPGAVLIGELGVLLGIQYLFQKRLRRLLGLLSGYGGEGGDDSSAVGRGGVGLLAEDMVPEDFTALRSLRRDFLTVPAPVQIPGRAKLVFHQLAVELLILVSDAQRGFDLFRHLGQTPVGTAFFRRRALGWSRGVHFRSRGGRGGQGQRQGGGQDHAHEFFHRFLPPLLYEMGFLMVMTQQSEKCSMKRKI